MGSRPGESRSRAINVPLAGVSSGISRLLTDNRLARSAIPAHTNTSLCKQRVSRMRCGAEVQQRPHTAGPALLDGFLGSTGLDLTPFCNPTIRDL